MKWCRFKNSSSDICAVTCSFTNTTREHTSIPGGSTVRKLQLRVLHTYSHDPFVFNGQAKLLVPWRQLHPPSTGELQLRPYLPSLSLLISSTFVLFHFDWSYYSTIPGDKIDLSLLIKRTRCRTPCYVVAPITNIISFTKDLNITPQGYHLLHQ